MAVDWCGVGEKKWKNLLDQWTHWAYLRSHLDPNLKSSCSEETKEGSQTSSLLIKMK